jgi:xanthine dehydrogenase YagR molybdenum-binding subunit
MKFDTPAAINPIDRMKVVGQPHDRIDGPLKTTGTAPYAYERHDVVANQAYGYIVGSAIAKGRITAMMLDEARAAPGVIAIVTAASAGPLGKGRFNNARLLAGPDVEHYHQAVAMVVAESFEQARAAAALVRVDYAREAAQYDLAASRDTAIKPNERADGATGDFAGAFASAPVAIDQTYTTPDHSHAMMEPHASIAAWEGDKLTVWTSNQMINWGKNDLAKTLGIPADSVRLISPYIGGGFGGKLFLRSDAVMAALGARAAGRPVKVTLQRPLLFNNATHRAATIQRIRIGCTPDGTITAIGHQSWSGDLPGGKPENATDQTRQFYAGANRMVQTRLAALNLPEANSMRAPGEAPGLMALEIAMDEMAEKLGMDPVAFRIKNDTQVSPEDPNRPFSKRQLVECLQQGAQHFDWDKRKAHPGSVRDGHWLIGMGVGAGYRGAPTQTSAARVRLDAKGHVTVETDMTDIGTGSYTILAQTAAEMMGVAMDQVTVRLGDSSFPASSGSGGQWGAASSTAGLYAACTTLRNTVAAKLGMSGEVDFADGHVRAGTRSVPLGDAARDGEIVVVDQMDYGDLARKTVQATFAGHFVEVAVNAYTGEVRIRRMLAVCSAGRILNPVTARSQVIGAMTMGVGAALMEDLAVDKRFGFFVNHDLAGYEVPVHADIPHQEVIFLDEIDPMTSPMKAKGVGELGLCGVGGAVANAIYNATGVRVRDYPVTLDRYLDKMPVIA